MTIITPHRRFPLRNFFIVLALILLGGGGFCITQYQALAESRHALVTLKDSLVRAEEANAENKNNLYAILDASGLETLATQNGLVSERHPEYLPATISWQSDFSR